jgi:type I restriction enzyme S subunit
MALCDRMEAEQADAEAAHATLVQTLLGTLTQSRDAAELAANWQRLSQHFDTLFTTEASLDALKQTILQLAVMGKLVPQDPNDKSTQLGLSNAFETRRALVKKGALAKKCLTETAWLTEPPFAIPEQWEFAYFDHLAAQRSNALKAGPFGSALKKDCYVPHGYKIYGQEQVIKQDAFFGDYYINENKFNQLKSCEACPGDLLISLVGTIGKVLILPPNAEPGIINPRLIKMSLNRDLVDPAYIRVLLAARWVREFLFAESHGSTMDVLNLTILRSLPIPLPPLAEQHCIVAKVDELMALCDSLKADLAESRARQARLATTLIESALQAA